MAKVGSTGLEEQLSRRPQQREEVAVLIDRSGGREDGKDTGNDQSGLQSLLGLFSIQTIVIVLLGTLGISSAVLGAFAEYYSEKLKEFINLHHKCIYPDDLVMAYSKWAILTLVVAHALANGLGLLSLTFTGEVARNDRDGAVQASAAKNAAQRCLILSWVYFLIAFYSFAAGAIAKEKNDHGKGCKAPTLSTFVRGSLFALFSVKYGISFYSLGGASKACASGQASAPVERP